MNMKNILSALIVTLLVIGFGGCSSGGDSSSAVVNTNEYNVRAMPTTDYTADLNLTYSTGETGTMHVSRVYTGDSFFNGIPVKVMLQTSTSLILGNTFLNIAETKYDINGTALEIVLSDDTTNGIICTLVNIPTLLPTVGKVGDSSTVSAEYSCTDGTSVTQRWSILDAGNGNAYVTFTVTDYDSANSLYSVTEEQYTVNSSSVVTYLNVYTDSVQLGITVTASGPVQLQ